MNDERIKNFESRVLVPLLGVRFLVNPACGFSGSQYQAYQTRCFSFFFSSSCFFFFFVP